MGIDKLSNGYYGGQFKSNIRVISMPDTNNRHRTNKRSKSMAQISLKLLFAYILGIPVTAFAFISSIDWWQKAVLGVLLSIYWGGMIYFGFRRKRRQEKKENLEIRQMEIDMYEKENDLIKKHRF